MRRHDLSDRRHRLQPCNDALADRDHDVGCVTSRTAPSTCPWPRLLGLFEANVSTATTTTSAVSKETEQPRAADAACHPTLQHGDLRCPSRALRRLCTENTQGSQQQATTVPIGKAHSGARLLGTASGPHRDSSRHVHLVAGSSPGRSMVTGLPATYTISAGVLDTPTSINASRLESTSTKCTVQYDNDPSPVSSWGKAACAQQDHCGCSTSHGRRAAR